VLAPDVSERRERSSSVIAQATRETAQLSHKLSEQKARLARLPEPSPLLAIPAEVVRALDISSGAARKALEDLPKRQAAAQTLRDAIEHDLARLGLGTDLELVVSRSLPVGEQARLQALARDFQNLSLKLENAERDLPAARAEVEALASSVALGRSARRLERDALLPAEVLERYEGELAQAEEAVEGLEQRARAAEREREQLSAQQQRHHGQDGVPSEARLSEARAERDARLREAQELAADPKRKALELSLPLAALAQAQSQADGLVDRLRKEAERVAAAELLEQRLLEAAREQAALASELQVARTRLSDVVLRWQRTLRSISQADLLPREVARLMAQEREAHGEVSRSEQALARARANLAAVEERATAARAQLAKWQVEWQAASAPLGLPEGSRPEQALALIDLLADLGRKRQELLTMERRVDGIGRVIDEFADKVKGQTATLAPPLAALSPLEAAARLVELHAKATDDARERRAVLAEIERLQRELGETQARAEAERQALADLCREAGVVDAPSLAELEAKVARSRELDAELERLDARLAELCEGENVVALADEARQSDKLVVAARLAELDDLIALCEEDWRALEGEVARLKAGLQAYEGEEGAEAAQELSATVARMAELSAIWVRKRLASVVLERVVDSYRERNQGPVLSRAGELFNRLTLGGFSRLQVGLEEARLECIRADDGKGLEVKELSRGTRFQLYLALKLASLERYVRTAPPLPLVLDDVLVEFDESRAKVALAVLAEFSEHTQILLFTHLARDVEAARELGDSRIVTHHLVRPEPAWRTEHAGSG
jgi:uncharacterized protein YhaN